MPARTASAAGASPSANTVGPAPEIEQPSAPPSSAACFTSAKPGISTWRCGSITTSEQRLADQRQVVRVAAGKEAGEIGLLPDDVRQRDRGAQDRARLARREHHVRMHEHAAHARGHRNLLHARIVDAHRQHQPAEQRRRDVVRMHRAAGDRLALHREAQQLRRGRAAARPAPPRPRRPPRPRPPNRRGRSPAECPSRCRGRSRARGRARAPAPARPCRRCSARPRAAGPRPRRGSSGSTRRVRRDAWP